MPPRLDHNLTVVTVRDYSCVDPSALPRLTALIQSQEQIREAATSLLPMSICRSLTDHVLAAFVPQLRRPIVHFYAERGGRLLTLMREDALKALDERLSVAIPELARSWLNYRFKVVRSGGSVSAAAEAFSAQVLEILNELSIDTGDVAHPQSTRGTRRRQ